jgi:transcriptional regulator with XRE-family HTH domain
MSILAKRFGARLRELRTGKGLLLSELGSESYVCDVEAGRKAPTFRRIELFAERLRCDPLELFKEARKP